MTAEQFKGFVEHELKWLKESVSVLASEALPPSTGAFPVGPGGPLHRRAHRHHAEAQALPDSALRHVAGKVTGVTPWL